jgi:inhibitor of the pro-sigma K processing machinery
MEQFLNELMNFLVPFYPLISYALVAIILILLLKLFHFKIKTIITILINIIAGGLVLFLINYIPGIDIQIDIIKSLIVGVFGLPGVIVILILHFFF